MKKILLLVCACMMGFMAQAGWVKVTGKVENALEESLKRLEQESQFLWLNTLEVFEGECDLKNTPDNRELETKGDKAIDREILRVR